MRVCTLISLAILISSTEVNTLNILGIFSYQGKSNFFVYEALLKELAARGHTVTVISYFPQDTPITNYNDISLKGKADIYENVFSINNPSYWKVLYMGVFLIQTGASNCRILLSDDNVQNLWKSEKKIDVVITEQFNSDCGLALAYKLEAPVVGITSNTLMPYHHHRYGIPNNPYTPLHFLSGETKPTLFQRIERALFTIYFQYFIRVLSQKIDEYTLSQHFKKLPPLEELGRNVKFLLLYDHFVFPAPSIISTNIIQVGGLHVAKPQTLPKELEKFVNESRYGVIVINFGTMINSSAISDEKLEAITNATRELKQRIIWKWDLDNVPGNLKNVYISNWLPLNDILAHPKAKAMFSHCGMLGVTEAIHYGVPLVCMPIYGDQPYSASAVEERGLGVQIQFDDLTKDKLLEKYRTILDKKFRENVKRLSKMWHDRPIRAMDSAVFWVEYTARYHNVSFTSPSANVPLYQFLCLDIIFTLFIFCLGLYFIINYIASLLFKKKQVKSKYKKPKLK